MLGLAALRGGETRPMGTAREFGFSKCAPLAVEPGPGGQTLRAPVRLVPVSIHPLTRGMCRMSQNTIREVVQEVDGLVEGLMAQTDLPTPPQLEVLRCAAVRLAALLGRAANVPDAEACRAANRLTVDYCAELAQRSVSPCHQSPRDLAITKEDYDEHLELFRSVARRALR